MDQNLLREIIKKYCEQTGLKKGKIAQDIGESQSNFSRWLTGKRNYGPIKENQIVIWLKERGVLND